MDPCLVYFSSFYISSFHISTKICVFVKADMEKLSRKAGVKDGSGDARRQERGTERAREKTGFSEQLTRCPCGIFLQQNKANTCAAVAPKTQFKHWSIWVLFC